MAQILLFSDLHVHKHKKSLERLDDCLDALHWIFDEAERRKVDHIIFAGDLLHDRTKIDANTFYQTYKAFRDFSRKNVCNTTLLVGNHDMYHKDRWENNSLEAFGGLPNIEVVQKPLRKIFGNRNFDFLPYTNNPTEHLKTLALPGYRYSRFSSRGSWSGLKHLAQHDFGRKHRIRGGLKKV